jgi:hypothetical protein
MATATTSTLFRNNSDAEFRAWGSWFSDRFVAFGWVEAFSLFGTGTNWTDVTAPNAANQARVTKVFRMDDAAQATAPLFLKLEFGSGGVATTPGIRIRFGTGHDGSGNITGELYDSSVNFLAPGAVNVNSMTHYASGDNGSFRIQMASSGTSWLNTNAWMFSIERRKNGAGANQDTGFLYLSKNGSSMRSQGFLASAAHPLITSALHFPCILSSVPNATFDSKTGVYPHLFCMGPVEMGINVVGCILASNPVGTQFTCAVLGATRNYIALQDTGLTALLGGSSIAMAILYE